MVLSDIIIQINVDRGRRKLTQKEKLWPRGNHSLLGSHSQGRWRSPGLKPLEELLGRPTIVRKGLFPGTKSPALATSFIKIISMLNKNQVRDWVTQKGSLGLVVNLESLPKPMS
eukprot:6490924-Amphidinium_carterae.1